MDMGQKIVLWLLSFAIIIAILPADTRQLIEGLPIILLFGAFSVFMTLLQSWIFWAAIVAAVVIYLLMSIRAEIIASRGS